MRQQILQKGVTVWFVLDEIEGRIDVLEQRGWCATHGSTRGAILDWTRGGRLFGTGLFGTGLYAC